MFMCMQHIINENLADTGNLKGNRGIKQNVGVGWPAGTGKGEGETMELIVNRAEAWLSELIRAARDQISR